MDYPFTIYDRAKDQTLKWLGFVYAFLYYNNKEKRVLRLERPCSFVESEKLKREVYSCLLNHCTKIAKLMHVDLLELELYRRIGGEICFPSTLSYTNSYNAPEMVEFFKRHGFQKRITEFVFILPTDIRSEKIDSTTNSYAFKRYGYSPLERMKYWSLWFRSPYCLERIFPRHDAVWKLNYGLKAADDPRFIIFAWKNDNIIGFVHWFPNFYRINNSWRTKKSEWVFEQGIRSGKIFKIIIDPAFDSKDVRTALCLAAIKTMRDCGITKIQIGNIYDNDKLMLKLIEELGGKRLHILDFLEKKA